MTRWQTASQAQMTRHNARHDGTLELLDEWNLLSCKVVSTPFPSKVNEFPAPPSNSLPDISDTTDLTTKYQRIVSCLLYLISTHLDISYYAMWLGQYNSKPTRAHFLAAKHVLRYLAGTKTLALRLGSPSTALPATMSSFMQNVGCSASGKLIVT